MVSKESLKRGNSKLKPLFSNKRQIFVFGSNTEGRHGKGAALEAKKYHGAIYGQAEGLQGDSYAIITKDLSKGRRSISLDQIYSQIEKFIVFACDHPYWIFNVSPIGCGLAGYTPEEIAPMFWPRPANVILPEEFIHVINGGLVMAVTGHRPDKLGNEYSYDGPYSAYIGGEMDRILLEYKPIQIISGMALGVDTLWAVSGLYLNIPLLAAIPFKGQEGNWFDGSKDIFNAILNHKFCTEKFICEPGYAAWKMQKRNEWMVDHCDILVAVWDGVEDGGTWNCIKYARSKGRFIIYIDPKKAVA